MGISGDLPRLPHFVYHRALERAPEAPAAAATATAATAIGNRRRAAAAARGSSSAAATHEHGAERGARPASPRTFAGAGPGTHRPLQGRHGDERRARRDHGGGRRAAKGNAG